MLDGHPVFDSLRLSFLLPGDVLAKTVVEAIYELADQRTDGVSFRVVADGILNYLDNSEGNNDGWGGSLKNDVLRAYLQMVGSRAYYFSVNELVWICKAMSANITVAQRYNDAYIVEQY